MKVLRILTATGSIFHMTLERMEGYVGTRPDFPDAVAVELVEMTPEQYLDLAHPVEPNRRFAHA